MEIIAHNFSMTQPLQLKLSCLVPHVYGTRHASQIYLEFFCETVLLRKPEILLNFFSSPMFLSINAKMTVCLYAGLAAWQISNPGKSLDHRR